MNRPLQRGLLAAVLIGAIGLAFAYRDLVDVATLEEWVAGAGPAGPLLFMALYAIATVLFLPGSVLTLTGGALFGPLWGTLYNLIGATLGAALAFLVARYLASDWVQARLAGGTRGRIERLVKGVEAEGWRIVAFTRLVPLFPFNLLNYALGLTRIPFLHYLIASFVCMLPGALAYTYLGYAGREAVAGGEGLVQKGLIALALLAAAAILPRLVSKLRERPMLEVTELKRRLDAGEDLLVMDVRTAADFVGEQGHLTVARNLPLEELADRVDELGEDPERAIAIVCRTDRRSAKAAALLTQRGFANVHVVRGGMTAWLEHGWPSQRSPAS
ncbi:MAG: VTT domain-containing protein [Chromatiaceae bacterium]|nr:VTT domain-containing protein [Chromatiaceae bacterium]